MRAGRLTSALPLYSTWMQAIDLLPCGCGCLYPFCPCAHMIVRQMYVFETWM
jgi:hypothetical protein